MGQQNVKKVVCLAFILVKAYQLLWSVYKYVILVKVF